MAQNNTTILYIPGAWHPASTFRPVSNLLTRAGYTVHLIDLPSVGPQEHLPDFSADVSRVREYIRKEVDAGRELVLVGHSYGSIPMCEAARGFSEGRVRHLVFCCAFIVDEGESLIGAFGGEPLPWFRVSADGMEVNPATPEDIFYNDLEPKVQEEMIAQLKPQSYQVMHTPVTYAAWKVRGLFLVLFRFWWVAKILG